MLADRSAEAEVVRVGQFAFVLDLLALDADVGNPVLPAAVGAAGYVQAQLLVELGKALFHLFDEPAREAFGLGDGQLAELGAGAGHRAAPEHGTFDVEPDLAEFAGQFAGLAVRDIDEEQILRNRGADSSAAEALGELGGGFELLARQAAAEHGCADVCQARLPLRMNPRVIAIHVLGNVFLHSRPQLEVEARLQFFEESVGRPTFLHEEVFQAGAVAALAERHLVAKDLGDTTNGGDGLAGLEEDVQPDGKVRFVGETAAHAKRIAGFSVVLHGGQADVVNFRIRAPRRTAGGRDFELARQVVEIGIGGEEPGDAGSDGGSVDDLVGGDAGERTPGDVADDV